MPSRSPAPLRHMSPRPREPFPRIPRYLRILEYRSDRGNPREGPGAAWPTTLVNRLRSHPLLRGCRVNLEGSGGWPGRGRPGRSAPSLLEPVEGLRRVAHARVDRDVDEVGVLDARVPRLERLGDRVQLRLTAAPIPGSMTMPTPKVRKAWSRLASAPASGGASVSAPPSRRSSSDRSGEPEPGPAASTMASIAAAGSSSSSWPLPAKGTGSSGSMWRWPSDCRRSRREGVELGAELAQRPQQLAAGVLRAQVGGLDDHQLATADGLGDVGQRRDLKDPRPRAHLVGQAGAHSRHAWRTSAVRSHGQASMPA